MNAIEKKNWGCQIYCKRPDIYGTSASPVYNFVNEEKSPNFNISNLVVNFLVHMEHNIA